MRYIHLYPAGAPDPVVRSDWDDHKDIFNSLRTRCPNMDQAAGTLIRDLKRRGLLDETLVVGAVSSAARQFQKPATDGITILTVTRCAWRAAA